MADNTETPAETLNAATEKNVLPTGKLSLIGTFEKPGGSVALIRTAKGKISKVTRGDRIGAATVMAIRTGVLYLARGQNSQTLSLSIPGPAGT